MNTSTHNPCEATQTVGRCYGFSHVKQFGTSPLLAACYSLSGVLCFGEVSHYVAVSIAKPKPLQARKPLSMGQERGKQALPITP